MKKHILILFTFFLLTSALAQKNDTLMVSNRGIYSKWRISFSFTPNLGFNLGKKAVPPAYYESSIVSSFIHSYVNYTNHKETSQLGYEIALEVISKSFFKNKLIIKTGLGIESFYYKGTATINTTTVYEMPPPTKYTYDTCVDCEKYYYKNNFINLYIIPQFNIYQNNKLGFYTFIGASFSRIVFEKNSSNQNEWGKNAYTEFGIAGIGSAVKISKGFILDTRIRFTCQLPTTPYGRRLASVGFRAGFMF